MRRFFGLCASLAACMGTAQAATDVMIEIDRGRTEGVFSRKPVFQRAILMKPDNPGDTALLVFRGAPGYANLQSLNDKMRNLVGFLRPNLARFMAARIAIVVMDCPTDQQGAPGFNATSCLDDYRMSKTHADDVRSVMDRLRQEHGLSRFFILGHSAGTLSSRWLARNLGNEIAGSIHSATINNPSPRIWYSGRNFPYQEIAAPVLHIHHENDACLQTPHALVKEYAGDRLTTVRGGRPEGDPCATHFHSYVGREEAASIAVLGWIQTGVVVPVVGE